MIRLPFSPDATWTLAAVILAGVALSIWLEQRYKWAARLSGPVIGLLLAMTLSTTGVMPTKAPVYDFVGDYLMPLAIPMLLFQANVFRIIRVTGKMFVAFHLSVIGTVVGTIIAVQTVPIPQAPILGGIMAASYSGGSVNFLAVKETFKEVVHDDVTNPLIVADNFIMAGMFMVLLVLASSRFVLRRFAHPCIAAMEDDEDGTPVTAVDHHWAPKPIGLKDIALCLAIAGVLTAAATGIADALKPQFSGVAKALLGNTFVWLTLLSLIVATLGARPLARIQGGNELGGYLLYAFLFTIGLPANLLEVLANVPMMFTFCTVIAVINLAVTLGLGFLLRQNLEDLLLSVNATLGGPPSAVAMAVSKGWSPLILPAMLVGIWGYVIGTTIGVALAEFLS